jgi:hypothetical protein
MQSSVFLCSILKKGQAAVEIIRGRTMLNRWSVPFFSGFLFFALGGCSLDKSSLVDVDLASPTISSPALSIESIDTDTMFVNGAKNPGDILTASIIVTVKSKGAVSSVSSSIVDPATSSVLQSADLHDDGVFPDAAAGDSIFTGSLTFSFQRSFVGEFTTVVRCTVPNGRSGNEWIVPLRIRRGNTPPTLSNLQAPDTVVIGSTTQLIQLTVRAADVDGLDDVQKVQFKSYFPETDTIPRGNPILLFDDGGSSGDISDTDLVPGDGIFTVTIQLPPTVSKGTRRFEFQAFDRAGSGSNIINKLIVVM